MVEIFDRFGLGLIKSFVRVTGVWLLPFVAEVAGGPAGTGEGMGGMTLSAVRFSVLTMADSPGFRELVLRAG